MAKKPETLLAEKCMSYVRSIDGDVWHVHGSMMQRAGEPDLDGAVPTPGGNFVHFKIELKVGKNQPSPLQIERLRRWNLLGYTVGVVWSLQEFIALLQYAATMPDSPTYTDYQLKALKERYKPTVSLEKWLTLNQSSHRTLVV